MTHDIFKSGGPHQIRKTGPQQHEFSISLPPDRDGRVARECPESTCSPGEFKITPRTGISGGQKESFCPYCRKTAAPTDFTTEEQIRYAKEVVAAQAHEGMQKALGKAFGLNSRGKRSLTKGGPIDVTIEMKHGRKPLVRRPYADVLKRDVVCPCCGLDHSVYGLATYCPDCGADIFSTHILGEIRMIHTALMDVTRRERELGERIAAKDVENALEDLVSIFEAVLKREVRASLNTGNRTAEEIDIRMKKIGSRLQSVSFARENLDGLCGASIDFFDSGRLSQLDDLFQKRHPITHNLGVIDRAYLKRISSLEKEGREIRVSKQEVSEACTTVFELLETLHLLLFPGAAEAKQTHPQEILSNTDDL